MSYSDKKKEVCHVRTIAKEGKERQLVIARSAAELNAMYQAAAPHLKRAIMLAYYTGMRVGSSELFAVRWEHVDLINGHVFVESAKKGGMKIRMVPIASALDILLREWLLQDSESGRAGGWLVHYHGKRVSRIKTAWNSAKRRAGITRRMRPYDLRHMAATDMLESEVAELREALSNLVSFAKACNWDKYTTGRQILIRDAERALKMSER